jgi:hypothetical protein
MKIEKLPSALALIGAVTFAGGCAAHVSGTAYGEADAPVVNVDNPTLVEVDAGVWVIRDYDEPVYFVNDDYWLFRNGTWYRSHGLQGGWVLVEASAVPNVIVRRDHRAYLHYHGGPAAQTRAAPRRAREGVDHPGRPEQAGEAHGVHQDHDEGHGPGNEHKAEERHEERHDGQGDHDHDAHAEHQEGHDQGQGHANDPHRGDDGRGKKNEKDRGRKK